MKTSKFRLSLLAWLGFGFAFPTICFSQTREAHLRGNVTDPSGAGVAGAEVVAQREDNPAAKPVRTASLADGSYALALPAKPAR